MDTINIMLYLDLPTSTAREFYQKKLIDTIN